MNHQPTTLTQRLHKMGMVVALLAATGSLVAACSKDQPKTAAADAAKPAATAAAADTTTQAQGKTINIGVDANFPPMVFRGGDGSLTGFDIDLANEAFKRIGQEYDFHDIHWGTKDRQLNQDKSIDVIWSGFNISNERRQVYEFTEPYMANKQVVVVLANSPIQTLADLNGKTVGVQQGSSLGPRLQALGNITVKAEYPEYAAELVALSTGEVDAIAAGDVAVSYYMQNTPGKFRILNENLGETFMAAAVRKEDRALLAKLNTAIEAMKADGTVQRIRSQWFK